MTWASENSGPPGSDRLRKAISRIDRHQLQRGFQVFKEVCASCHSMRLMAFRNLSEPGGPEFSEAQVKALAATYEIAD
ncbi:MAG: cytochrome c1, partial [Hyphomicrobiales bacterium]